MLLFVLIIALVNYVVGVFIPCHFDPSNLNSTEPIPSKWLKVKKLNSEGHFYGRSSIARENLYPDFSSGENFFTVFTIFFPATTGILAGSNISGDLKNPSVAIPKGTFTAIGITSLVYCIFTVLIGSHSTRLASGFFGQVGNFSGKLTFQI